MYMDVFTTSYDILVVALILMGLILSVIPVGKDIERLRSYRVSLKFLAFSYVVLGVYCIYKVRYPVQMLSVPFLVASCIQANFLGLAHINLVNLRRVTRKYVLLNFIPLVVCIASYVCIRLFCPHIELTSIAVFRTSALNPEVFIRIMWLLAYASHTTYYAVVFFKEEAKYRANLRNFLSEAPAVRYYAARVSFFVVLAIAITSLFIATSLDMYLSALLNLVMLVLYAVMCLFYVQYPSIFFKISSILVTPDMNESKDDDSKLQEWDVLKSRIIADKLYTIEGLTVEQLANRLNVSKYVLSRLVNMHEGVNFNNFIGKLRVEEAQRMMMADKSKCISEIAMTVGYSEQSNFSRQFKALTGFTPGEYRKTIN